VPGTRRAELFEMPVEDAVAILLADVADDELQQAARHVVECHAEEVVARFAPKPKPVVTMKVVRE
jgi:hypothetical protein